MVKYVGVWGIVATVLVGCGGGNSTRVDSFSFVAPRALEGGLSEGCASTLSASLVLDGERSFDMSRKGANWSVTIEGLEKGTHRFKIDFSCTDPVYGKIGLASAEKSFDLSGTEAEVSFVDSDYTYPDTDGDGVSNLAELEKGTNPLISDEIPNSNIASLAPAQGSQGVARDAEIEVVFARDVQADSVTAESLVVTTLSGATVKGKVDYDPATRTATFTREDPELWDVLAIYEVTLTTAIRDSAGEALLARDFTWRFVTREGQWVEAEKMGTGANPRIAADGNGNAMVVWIANKNKDVYTRSFRRVNDDWQVMPERIGSMTEEERHSGVSLSYPDVAMSSSGEAVAIWGKFGPRLVDGDILSRRYYPDRTGKRWGVVSLLSQGSNHKVVMDGKGVAVVSWTRRRAPHDIVSNVYAIKSFLGSGAWGEPQLIENSEEGIASHLDVVADARGNIMVAWEESQGYGTKSILANRYTADTGAWGQTQAIEQSSADAHDPALAVDKNGNIIAVWIIDNALWYNRFDVKARTWTTDQKLPEAGTSTRFDFDVVMEEPGNATVVSSQDNKIRSFFYNSKNGSWSVGPDVSSGARESGNPVIGIDARGHVIAAWYESTGESRSDIMASYLDPATLKWSTPYVLGTSDAGKADLRIAVENSGEAFVIWKDNADDIFVRQFK